MQFLNKTKFVSLFAMLSKPNALEGEINTFGRVMHTVCV